MPTISDVARQAGVSRTAVSFAFNDPSRLSSATLERILKAAEELGYFPDPVARSLSSKRVGALGLLVPQRTMTLFSNPYFAELLRGIGYVCDRHDFSILIVSPIEGSLMRAIQRAAADGFVVVGLDQYHPAFNVLLQRRVPLVTVSDQVVDGIPSVNVDEREGARQAAEHLLGLGHRDVLVIRLRPAYGEPESDGAVHSGYVTDERFAGYRLAFDAAGVPFRDDLVIDSESTWEGGRQAFQTAWMAGARPTAVLAMSDIVALGAASGAGALGLAVPSDLSIIGFDDIPAARWVRPQLTTVHQSAVETGMRAAGMLIDRLLHDATPDHVVLPAGLVVRETTAEPGHTFVGERPA